MILVSLSMPSGNCFPICMDMSRRKGNSILPLIHQDRHSLHVLSIYQSSCLYILWGMACNVCLSPHHLHTSAIWMTIDFWRLSLRLCLLWLFPLYIHFIKYIYPSCKIVMHFRPTYFWPIGIPLEWSFSGCIPLFSISSIARITPSSVSLL